MILVIRGEKENTYIYIYILVQWTGGHRNDMYPIPIGPATGWCLLLRYRLFSILKLLRMRPSCDGLEAVRVTTFVDNRIQPVRTTHDQFIGLYPGGGSLWRKWGRGQEEWRKEEREEWMDAEGFNENTVYSYYDMIRTADCYIGVFAHRSYYRATHRISGEGARLVNAVQCGRGDVRGGLCPWDSFFSARS